MSSDASGVGSHGKCVRWRSWSATAVIMGAEEGERGLPVPQQGGAGTGAVRCQAWRQRRSARPAAARSGRIDAPRYLQAEGALANAEAVGDVAEDMDPNRPAGGPADGRIRGRQAGRGGPSAVIGGGCVRTRPRAARATGKTHNVTQSPQTDCNRPPAPVV